MELRHLRYFVVVAEEEHGGRGTMVGTQRVVALDAPAEFAEGHAHHTVLHAHQLQVVLECADVVAQCAEQVGVVADGMIPWIHL